MNPVIGLLLVSISLIISVSVYVNSNTFAYANNYDPVLEDAKNKLSSYIDKNKPSAYLPIFEWGVDYQNFTLFVGINDTAPLAKSVYEQRLRTIVGNVPLTIEFGHFNFDVLPPANLGNRKPDTMIKIISANDTSHPLDRYVQLRFIDTKTNQTIQPVSFWLNITRDDHIIVRDFFYTSSGFFSALLEPNDTVTKWSVYGDNEPVLNAWIPKDGILKISTPLFQNGLYHIHLEVQSFDFSNGMFTPSTAPKFDSWWTVDKNGNFESYVNSSNSTQEPIAINDTITITKQSFLSPLKQFKSGILAKDIQCKQGLVLIKKLSENSPACVKPDTAQKLVERGWGSILPNNTQEPAIISGDASKSSHAYDASIIKQIQKMINDCTYSRIQLGYALGSEIFSLAKGNNTCNVSITGEIEMGAFGFDCNVPLQNMTKWINWKDVDIPPFPNDIMVFCKKTS